MYSKKVLEHFQNPRNQGKIMDADGIGKVGNPVCLLPKEMLHTRNQLKPISMLKNTDFVLGNNKSYDRIKQVANRKYNGETIILKNRMGSIKLTPEHLVLAIKIPSGQKYLRTKHKKTLVPAWYHASQLKKGDIALYPIYKEMHDKDFLNFSILERKYDFKSNKNIPEQIPLGKDFLRLCGYYLAEGYISEKASKTFVSFSLNINEDDIVEDIRRIVKKMFCLDISVRKIPQRKTVQVYVYNVHIARFLKGLFGSGADKKLIPQFIMSLPPAKQKALIYGMWRGDGYINLNRDGPRAGYSTISYQLAHQLKMLLLRQKIMPSIYKEEEKIVKGVRHKKGYRIHVGQRDSLKRLSSIFGIKYAPRSYPSIDSWIKGDYLFMPISKIEKINYEGEVYNLEVEDSHSFASEAFCLHNCGDVMYIYIKVKDNKIVDISFETMGCAAAIATSSMITELAKGKTLDQAMKITKQDIADALEELPPIKMHCSNLAADGLHKAIEDYLKKKKEKR